jgi:hypothetical protein
MATRKQIAAARRNIKKAQAANRKKRRAPAKRKTTKRRAPKRGKRASKAKNLTKKVGGSVVRLTGRKLYVGGATHSYKTNAAGLAAYRRIRSKKVVASFKSRYGKIKRVARKVTRGRNKGDTVGWTKQRRGKSRGKMKPRYLLVDVPPKNRSKYAKKRRPSKRNPRSAAELKRILRRHGYSV